MNLKTTNSITMHYKFILILLSVFFLLAMPRLMAQDKQSSKLAKLERLNEPARTKVNYVSYLKRSKNEIEGTASILFLTYKSFFSSQDQNSCVFTPSCSVYAIESLEHYNPIVAYLKIFDRLERCHGLVAKGEYEINYKTQQYYDPAF